MSENPGTVTRFPEIEVFGDSLVTVWNERTSVSEILMRCSEDRGRTFTAATRISTTAGGSSGAPALAIGHDLVALAARDDRSPSDPFVNTAPVRSRIETVGRGGCAGPSGTPTMRASHDLSGASRMSLGVSMTRGRPGSAFFLAIAAAQKKLTSFPVLGCDIDLDPSKALLVPGVTSQAGTATLNFTGPFPSAFLLLQTVGSDGPVFVATPTLRLRLH